MTDDVSTRFLGCRADVLFKRFLRCCNSHSTIKLRFCTYYAHAISRIDVYLGELDYRSDIKYRLNVRPTKKGDFLLLKLQRQRTFWWRTPVTLKIMCNPFFFLLQLQAARDSGARPVTCLSAFWRKKDRLPAVQQPEEPRQVQRTRTRLLPEKLRRRWLDTTSVSVRALMDFYRTRRRRFFLCPCIYFLCSSSPTHRVNLGQS